MHGFTCGIGDLLLVPRGERDRRHKLRKADKLGEIVHARFSGVKDNAIGLNLALHSKSRTLFKCFLKLSLYLLNVGFRLTSTV